MTILDAAAQVVGLYPRRAEPRAGWPCCEWVARVVARAYGVEDVPSFAPGGPWWRAANVWDATLPWSSVDAYTPSGAAVGHRAERPVRGHWHVVQGWRRLTADGHVPTVAGINGHTWLWYAVDETSGIALESSVAGGVRLAGELVTTPDRLSPLEYVEAMAWADRIAPYAAGVRMAVLRPVALSAGDDATEREGGPIARPVAVREAIEGAIADAHQQVAIALDDGHISREEALAELARMIAVVLDALLPTGPVDPYDDPVIRAGVERVVVRIADVVADAVQRDPDAMRARADEIEARNPERAARIRARADRVEGRRK